MKLSGSHPLSFGWLSQHRQKSIKRGSVTQLIQRSEVGDQKSAVSDKGKPQVIPQSREYRTPQVPRFRVTENNFVRLIR